MDIIKINSENEGICKYKNRWLFLNDDAIAIMNLIENNNKEEINNFIDENKISYEEFKNCVTSIKNQMKNLKEVDSETVNFDYPVAIQWKITENCNLKCKHCYVKPWEQSGQRLSNKELELILDKIIKIKPIYVLITGGECLMIENIDTIMERLYEEGIQVRIFTNGTLLDKQIHILKSISENCIINVSIDGLENAHDLIRGKGNFIKTTSNIKLCIENNIHIAVNTVINKINYKDFFDLYKFLMSLGVNSIQFSYLTLYGAAKDNINDLAMGYTEYKEFEEIMGKISEYNKKNGKHIDLYYTPYDEIGSRKLKNIEDKLDDTEVIDSWVCSAGRSRITINSKGNVYPCPFLEDKYTMGNIICEDIYEIWGNESRKEFLNFIKENTDIKNRCPIIGTSLSIEG